MIDRELAFTWADWSARLLRATRLMWERPRPLH
jgi:hypothetical protein